MSGEFDDYYGSNDFDQSSTGIFIERPAEGSEEEDDNEIEELEDHEDPEVSDHNNNN